MDEKTVKDVKDLLNYADGLVDEFTRAKSDDGKISIAETVVALSKTIPEGVSAVVGIENVLEQIKNANDKERAELLERSATVLIKLVNLFMASR